MPKIVELKNVSKTYKSGKLEVPVLHNINIQIEKGEMVAIMGPSGSGKSTLMNIIGLLDRPTEGQLKIDGENIDLSMSDAKLARLRSKKVGFVFQTFNLLPKLTALKNVLVPSTYVGGDKKEEQKKALDLLGQVGLEKRIKHNPTELSGGERQRVAIARALMNDPEIILADEPTGNLDSKSGEEILNILKDLNKQGKTLLIITHDENIAKHCQRIIHIKDGRIQSINK